MKIDFNMLEKQVAAGMPAEALLIYFRSMFERRIKDAARQRKSRASRAKSQQVEQCHTMSHDVTDKPSDVAQREYFTAGKTLLGKSAGGLLSSLLRHHNYDLPAARAVIDVAATKQDPREWVSASMRSKANGKGNDLMAACDDLLSRAGSGPVQGRDFDLDLTPERDGGD